jgi:DNA-binding transcriptional regulator YiaG
MEMIYMDINQIGLRIIAILYILFIIVIFISIAYLFYLIIKALKKYIKTQDIRQENRVVAKSLGEALKDYRTKNKMTQDFVAEMLGVSRQAVSKWESGTNDPNTSNLIALSKLYNVSPEELIKCVVNTPNE